MKDECIDARRHALFDGYNIEGRMGHQALPPGESMNCFICFTPVQEREDWSRVSLLTNSKP